MSAPIGSGCAQIEELIRNSCFKGAMELVKKLPPSAPKTAVVIEIFKKMKLGFHDRKDNELVLLTELLLMEGDIERAKEVLPFIIERDENHRLAAIVERALLARLREGNDFSI